VVLVRGVTLGFSEFHCYCRQLFVNRVLHMLNLMVVVVDISSIDVVNDIQSRKEYLLSGMEVYIFLVLLFRCICTYLPFPY